MKQEFQILNEEGQLIARMALLVGLDAADSAACGMASAIMMGCSSWLQSSQTFQDLPFEGPSLFSERTDVTA